MNSPKVDRSDISIRDGAEDQEEVPAILTRQLKKLARPGPRKSTSSLYCCESF